MNSETLIPECNECGGNDIMLDSYAKWDADKQDWILNNTFDAAVCEDCKGECSYTMIEVKVSKQAKVVAYETVGGIITIDFLINETQEQLLTRVKEQLEDMGIESFGNTFRGTHKDTSICGVEVGDFK